MATSSGARQNQQNSRRHTGTGPAMGNGISCVIAEATASAQDRKGIDRIASSLALAVCFVVGTKSPCSGYKWLQLLRLGRKNQRGSLRYFSIFHAAWSIFEIFFVLLSLVH
jgi:hypothetical protein